MSEKSCPSATDTIFHISDLHFGRTDEVVLKALKKDAETFKPDLCIVSGDLTMRARKTEFNQAKEFLDELVVPVLTVPGNHDIPAWNLFSRIVKPFARYRDYISPDLSPAAEYKHFAVYGLNTARRFSYRSFDWSRGRIRKRQLNAMTRWFNNIEPHKAKIVVGHHPFALPAQSEKRGTVGRLSHAIESFEKSRVELLLAGHLHQSFWTTIHSIKTPQRHRSLLAVQASTASSTRLKGEPNGYNLIDIDRNNISVQQRTWDGLSFSTTNTVTRDRKL